MARRTIPWHVPAGPRPDAPRRSFARVRPMDVFEAMGTARAIRYLKPDPVPTEHIEKLIWAATRASSPGNSQAWGFVVVSDAEKKARIGGAVSDAVSGFIRDPGPDADRSVRLMLNGA